MNLLSRAGAFALALLLPFAALAQPTPPALYMPSEGVAIPDENGRGKLVGPNNPLPTARQDGFPVTTTSASVNSSVLFTADTSGYVGVSVQISGTFVATYQFQASNDNVNWQAVSAQSTSTAYGIFAQTGTSGQLWYVPAQHRYVRVMLTAYTSGTVTSSVYLRQTNLDPSSPTVALGVGSSVIGSVYLNAIASSNIGTTPLLSYVLTSAASTNSNLIVAASSKRLIGGTIFNASASVKFVKFYAKATAPTVGTDTPSLVIPVAPGSTVMIASAASVYGQTFLLGLGIGITGGFANSDTTAVAAGDVLVNALYL